MAWYHRKPDLPVVWRKVIDKTVEALEKKCTPRKVIENDFILNKNMMSDEELARHSTESLKRLCWYFYHKGKIDGMEMLDQEKDSSKLESNSFVRKFEVNLPPDTNSKIIYPGNY